MRWSTSVLLLLALLCAVSSSPSPTEVFQNLFAVKRKEQAAAVAQLLRIEPERQEKLIGTMMDKIMDVLVRGRAHLEAAGVGGMQAAVPDDESTKNALALVLENTCFLADIVLRFPDALHDVFKRKDDWRVLFSWSLAFASESPLLDGAAAASKEVLHLASQEMGVVPKDESFVNPYKQERKKQKRFDDPPPKKKKEKKKLKKGPRMHRGEL